MKKKRIKTGIIAALSGIVALPGCDSASRELHDNTGAPGRLSSREHGTNNPNADSLRLEKRLKELSQTKYVGELTMGAMCYDMMAPMYVDYVCSYCGDTIKEKYNDWMLYNIEQIEEIVRQIKSKGYDVILDKKEFCPHCSKENIEYPELLFKFRFSSKAEYHIAKTNIMNDYQCLLAFLSNQDKYMGWHGEEYALHDHVTIIQKMTGLGKELKIANSTLE
jgi:hypothetical protein